MVGNAGRWIGTEADFAELSLLWALRTAAEEKLQGTKFSLVTFGLQHSEDTLSSGQHILFAAIGTQHLLLQLSIYILNILYIL